MANNATPTHVEKAGIGMKVTRALWDRYLEPSFWEVTRTKVAKRASPRAWGVLTFRGKRRTKSARSVARAKKLGGKSNDDCKGQSLLMNILNDESGC